MHLSSRLLCKHWNVLRKYLAHFRKWKALALHRVMQMRCSTIESCKLFRNKKTFSFSQMLRLGRVYDAQHSGWQIFAVYYLKWSGQSGFLIPLPYSAARDLHESQQSTMIASIFHFRMLIRRRHSQNSSWQHWNISISPSFSCKRHLSLCANDNVLGINVWVASCALWPFLGEPFF